MAKNEKTSKAVATKASKVLADPKSTKAMKAIAASALTQTADRGKKRT
jgi:hypothetical protein